MEGGAFISYRREDAAGFAGRLSDSLERLLPDEPVFRDVDGLSPGQDFVEAIDARLRQCRVCLAVIGRDWLNARDPGGRRRLDQPDDFVRLELIAALARPEVLVVPVLVEGAAMPPADELPFEIRALARRQAVSLRDDTWDADMARLVRSLQPAMASSSRVVSRTSLPFRMNWRVAAAAVGLLVLAMFVNALRSDEAATGPDNPSNAADTPAEAVSAARAEPAASTGPSERAARQLAIPHISQVGSKHLIYTLMSASLEPGGTSDTLRARVALENDGSTAVNFWDDSFRLVVNGDPIAPTSRLNTLVDGHATGEGDVSFAVRPGTKAGLLRIAVLQTSGEIALDLTVQAPPTAAPSPRSARAVVTEISREARPLVTTANLSATLSAVSTRRFANVLRVTLPLRLAATGPGAVLSNELMLRLMVGDDVLAPSAYPIEVLQAGSTMRLAAEFEVPPDTTRALLRATAGDARAEVPLTLR